MKNWKATVGKLVPWALGAIGGLLELLGIKLAWLPVAVGLITGAVQFVLSLIPDKPA